MQADFENYRKRMLREQTETMERASESILVQLLPVLDNFELALSNLDDADEKVRKGVEILYTELIGVLAKAGLEPIDASGKPFDPNEHEAVAQEDGDGEPVVCDILRAGYRLKGRVLRPATVRVTAPRTGPNRWHRSASGSTRTTTPSSVCNPARPTRTSSARTGSSRSSTTPTRTPVTPRRKSGSRRFPPRTTCSAIRRDARSTTTSARWWRAASGPAARAGTDRGSRGHRSTSRAVTSATCSATSSVAAGADAAEDGAKDRVPRRGADLETQLQLDFLDAVHGVTTSVSLTSDAACSECGGTGAERGTLPSVCPNCDGSGSVAVDQGPFSFSEVCPTCGGRGQVIEHRCKRCKGSGVERRRRAVKVRIPPGVRDAQRIRVKGRGAAGRNGGPPGDLYVVVHVQPHRCSGARAREPHGQGADHVHRGGARRPSEGADAR